MAVRLEFRLKFLVSLGFLPFCGGAVGVLCVCMSVCLWWPRRESKSSVSVLREKVIRCGLSVVSVAVSGGAVVVCGGAVVCGEVILVCGVSVVLAVVCGGAVVCVCFIFFSSCCGEMSVCFRFFPVEAVR